MRHAGTRGGCSPAYIEPLLFAREDTWARPWRLFRAVLRKGADVVAYIHAVIDHFSLEGGEETCVPT